MRRTRILCWNVHIHNTCGVHKMTDHEFKVGDHVRLKTGSNAMEVTYVRDAVHVLRYEVTYADKNGVVRRVCLSEAVLTPA